MEEVWKEVPGYEGYYEISSFGRVRSADRNVIYRDGQVHFIKGRSRRPNINNRGYYYLPLNKDGKHWYAKVHRLVAMAFLPNPLNLPEVNHKDGNKLNNHADNLEWCTHSENHKHLYKMGNSNIDYERERRKRKILQLDMKTGEVVGSWNSIIEAERHYNKTNPKPTNIWSCLKGHSCSAYGFKWKYNI